MTIVNYSLYCEELQREINFDLADESYYCDLLLDNKSLSINTLIPACNSEHTLNYKIKKYLSEKLSDPNFVKQAKSLTDFQLLKVNNFTTSIDLLSPIFEEYQQLITNNKDLPLIRYIKSFTDKENISEAQNKILNQIANFIISSDDPVNNFNQTIFDFEKSRNQPLLLSELNLARLNKKLILFNAAIIFYKNKKLSCSDYFDDRFFYEKNIKSSFPLNSKKKYSDLNLCFFNSAKQFAIEHFKNNSISSSFLSFHKSANYNLALEAININNFTSILLAENLAPMSQLNFLEELSNKNHLNSFISKITPGFKNSTYDLFNEIYPACMDYLANVLQLDLKDNSFKNTELPF